MLNLTEPHQLVPRGFEDNIRFRRDLDEWVNASPDNRQSLIDACSRDLLFFTSAMVWTYDPKRFPKKPYRPFIPFPFQEELLLELDAAIGKHDMVIAKSRDMGCSWMPLIVCDRLFLFQYGQKFLFMSEKKSLVDSADDPNSLFAKIGIIHQFLPRFMTAAIEKVDMKFTNRATGSMIGGSTTTDDAGRGGRDTAIICDEYGAFDRNEAFGVLTSTSGNCFSRIFISTPRGQGNAFHKVATDGNIPRRDVHWKQHPFHAVGLYDATKNGTVRLLDEKFWATAKFSWLMDRYPLIGKKISASPDAPLHECYPFTRDGKLRSPYYDHECRRMPFPWMVAQELDIDFVGSGKPFYDVGLIEDYIREKAQPPSRVGDLSMDPQTHEPIGFVPNLNGPLSIWCLLDVKNRPPKGKKYIIGCDISTGTGVTPSVASVFDVQTREKVARFEKIRSRPERFAEELFAFGVWWNDATIICEGQGPGKDFTGRLKDLRYKNLWYERTAQNKMAEFPGLFLNGESKISLLVEYGRALLDGEVINRDELALKEGEQYQYGPTGLVDHVESLTGVDPSGAKRNHSDRWAADALGWYLLRQKKVSLVVDDDKERRYGYMERIPALIEEDDPLGIREEYW